MLTDAPYYSSKIVPVPNYPSFKLEVTYLSSTNSYLARPAGQLGNVGNYPFLWIAAVSNKAITAVHRFVTTHSEDLENWQEAQLAAIKDKEKVSP